MLRLLVCLEFRDDPVPLFSHLVLHQPTCGGQLREHRVEVDLRAAGCKRAALHVGEDGRAEHTRAPLEPAIIVRDVPQADVHDLLVNRPDPGGLIVVPELRFDAPNTPSHQRSPAGGRMTLSRFNRTRRLVHAARCTSRLRASGTGSFIANAHSTSVMGRVTPWKVSWSHRRYAFGSRGGRGGDLSVAIGTWN